MSLGAGTNTNGYWNTTFNSATLADGFYNLSVNATTDLGTNITQNISITIDNTAANVSAVVPANSTTQTGSFLINASVNDTLTKVFNTTFKLIGSNTESAWLYAELNSGSIDQGYWNTTFDSTSISDGSYNITANATDFAGNQNIVNISEIIINNVPPNNTINLPQANANISGNFLINVSINNSQFNTNLVNLTILNTSSNATSIILMSLGSGTANIGYWNATINSANFPDGNYNLSVNATDSEGNQNISQNRSITIDNTASANISITGLTNTTKSTGNILINASVNDTGTKVFNVTFRLINPTTETTWLYAELTTGTISQGFWTTTFDTTTLTDGAYNITVNATDFAGNQNLANTTQITLNNHANKTIVSKGTDAYSIGLSNDGQTLLSNINNNELKATVNNPTNWHHYVLTYNGSNLTIYIDGQYANSSSVSGAINTNNNQLLIGEKLTGTIDELKIWKRPLSASEVSAEYNRTTSNYLTTHTVNGNNHIFSLNMTNLSDGTYNWKAITNENPNHRQHQTKHNHNNTN